MRRERGKTKERGGWRCLERIRESLETVRDSHAEHRGQLQVEGTGWCIARLDYEKLTENTSPDVVCLQGQPFQGLLESVGVVFLSRNRMPSTHPSACSVWRESQELGFSPALRLWGPHRVARNWS